MNNSDQISILTGFVFILIILLFIFWPKYIIIKVIRKHVLPKLKEKNLDFLDYKRLGPFDKSDFKDQKSNFSFIFSTGGSPDISLYVFVYYLNAGIKKRVTIKIDTVMMFIRKVRFSGEL